MLTNYSIKELTQVIDTNLDMLKPLEKSEQHVSGRKSSGPLIDETQTWIRHLKQTIESAQLILSGRCA